MFPRLRLNYFIRGVNSQSPYYTFTTLKSHPNVKVHTNYGLFYKHVGALSNRLSNFAKLVEFLKRSTVKASLNVFSSFPAWRYAKIMPKLHRISVYYHCLKCVQIQSFFWSVFSRIRTKYGEILRICPYSVRIRENTDQKKLRIWTLFTHCMLMKKSALKSIHGCISYRKQNLNAWNVNK